MSNSLEFLYDLPDTLKTTSFWIGGTALILFGIVGGGARLSRYLTRRSERPIPIPTFNSVDVMRVPAPHPMSLPPTEGPSHIYGQPTSDPDRTQPIRLAADPGGDNTRRIIMPITSNPPLEYPPRKNPGTVNPPRPITSS
ncbi:MAG TPA: hypothetical protein VLF43_02105 [Candidatus Saccharimonadales bacterium]|nr:hypothetical protein [Candidatus Saccharimonadales bacterium]